MAICRESVRMYYAHINNMGDALNGLLLERVFGAKEAEKTRIYNCDLMGIGSCLNEIFYGPGFANKQSYLIRERILGLFSGKCYIWGTGFLNEYPFETAKLKRKNVEFCMLRGELSRRGVSKAIGKDIQVPLGDGGLLAPLLIEEDIKKEEVIGIIPHFREKEEPIIQTLQSSINEKTKIIDVLEDPIKVIRDISSCKYIVSSSLHGLIVADSFGIPNTRVKFTDNPLGTGFKFDDYYSAFNMKKEAVNITNQQIISTSQLFDVPQVEQNKIKKAQEELYKSMKYILNQ